MELLSEITYTLLQLIPVGMVVSYGDLAKVLNVSPRVVGMILKRNRRPIVVPCHRVVMSDGKIGGYSGLGGAGFKRKILELEGVRFEGERVLKECFWEGIRDYWD